MWSGSYLSIVTSVSDKNVAVLKTREISPSKASSTAGLTPAFPLKTSMEPTVTVQVAIYPPSDVLAVIIAVPVPTGVTVPLDTTTTFWLLLDHKMFLFVALPVLRWHSV